MKKLIYSVAACSLLLCSCSDNDAIEEAVNNSHAIIASIEGTPETKLVITDNADATTENKASTLAWNADDQFWAWGTDKEHTNEYEPARAYYKIEKGTDPSKGIFQPNHIITPSYALYPKFDAKYISIQKETINKQDQPTIHLSLPNTYEASQLQAGSIMPPMFANISGNKADFKHLAGMLRINISKIPTNKNVSYSLKVSSTTHQLVGEFKIMNLSETQKLHKIIPAIKLADVPDNNTITIYNVPNKTNVYIPLPTIVAPSKETTGFSDLTFTLTKTTTDAQGTVTATETKTKTIKDITVARAKLYTLNLDYESMTKVDPSPASAQ